MLKYVDTSIVFQEIPDETTLAISISGCPCRCPGCHSSYLWADIGEPLTASAVDRMLSDSGSAVTCLCFMGGDADPMAVADLSAQIHRSHPTLRQAWYTGRTVVSSQVDRTLFDYIKVGPYIAHLGPLSSPKTNQHLYKRMPDNSWTDITSQFWRRQA